MEPHFEIIKKRTTLKLSTDLSPDEVREAIAKAMEIPVDEVPSIDFEGEKIRIRNEYESVIKIIGGYKAMLLSSSKTTADKFEELQDIGKFIFAMGNRFNLPIPEKIPKYPDFTLTYQGYKIGLEHTRLMSNEMKATKKTADYYLTKAEEIIAKDFSHLCKTVNVFIDYNEKVIEEQDFKSMKFTARQKIELPQLIADFIISEITGGTVPKPDFIRKVQITPNQDSRVDIELAESFWTQNEFSSLLLKRIKSKERKAVNYRNAVNVNVLWLMIVVDDVNSFSGFNLETIRWPAIQSSNFEIIFIFERFGNSIYMIFDKDH